MNAFIGVIFKFYGKHEIDNLGAIVVNYAVCILTASVTLGKLAIPTNIMSLPWFPYALVLGFIFIGVFTSVAAAVQKIGIVLTTIFHKMTMIVPAIIAILSYGESGSVLKVSGILLACAAIVVVQLPIHGDINKQFKKYWYLAAITFVGGGVIDGLLFYLEAEKITVNGDIEFVASLFLFAGIIGVALLLLKKLRGHKVVLGKKEIVGGIALGIPNFFSIYLLVLVLSKGWDGSIVFPINNVGILTLSTIFGILWFKEVVNSYRIIGFIMAFMAILFIANG